MLRLLIGVDALRCFSWRASNRAVTVKLAMSLKCGTHGQLQVLLQV